MDTHRRGKDAAPAEGSASSTLVVADVSTQIEVLKGDATMQTFLLGQGQAADMSADGKPRWRTSADDC